MSSVLPPSNLKFMGAFTPFSPTLSELKELKSEGLIGENSQGVFQILPRDSEEEPQVKRHKMLFWSEHTNAQWWALMDEGQHGKQAADYLVQMTSERRKNAADYLSSFYDISTKLNEYLSQTGAKGDLDQLLDNVAEGRPPTMNGDGSSVENAKLVESFWQKNYSDIETLQGRYDALKATPKQLSEWLDQNHIERPIEVDELIEKHRYSGFNGRAQVSEALMDGYSFSIERSGTTEIGRGRDGTISPCIFTSSDPFLFNSGISSAVAKRSAEVALMLGDAGALKGIIAVGMMQNEQKGMLNKYQNIYSTLETNFRSQFEALSPKFFVQNILDNLASGRDPAQLQDGNLHPDADRIRAFSENFVSLINAVQTQQQQFEALPKTTNEWLAMGNNNRKLDQLVFSQYGLEPWEKGSNSRALRLSMAPPAKFFVEADDEIKQKFINEALMRREHLEAELRKAIGQVSGLDLDTVLHNFRFDQPLGLMSDGAIHPKGEALATFIENNKEDVAEYIDWSWILGEQDNLSMVDYHHWMDDKRTSEFAEPLVDWLLESLTPTKF